MRQIEVGVLQTLPSAIIISMVTTIWSKMKKLRNKKNAILDEENSWMRIERNIRKIDKESYDDEPATVDEMHRFMEEQGYALDITDQRMHHEIYLSDARRVAPEKRKTVVRHPIRRA